MQVEVNNQDSIILPLLGHVIFGTDESCDFVFENSKDSAKKICSIINDKEACILEVFNSEHVFVNHMRVKEMCLLHAGDLIKIDKQQLKIINENKLPKNCSIPFKLNNQNESETHMLTSVAGLRSFNKDSNGELSIVGRQNSFTHKLLSQEDIPFSVSYIDDELTLLCKKDNSIEINGNKAIYAILRNGDFINTGVAKYCVESPGTSSFSKYSPSHPRNIQLSEEYLEIGNSKNQPTQQSTKQTADFFKKNLWWLTLLFGLIAIAAILYLLKNN